MEVDALAPTPEAKKPGRGYCHVRALNLAEDGVRLDVFLGGVMLANDVAYKHKGPYVRMDAGTLSAAAFFSRAHFRLYSLRRVALEDKAYTLVVTGDARAGSIWTVEDALQDRPRTVRLVNAAPGVSRASLFIPGRQPLAAAYREATGYHSWPFKCAGLVLHALYANEDLRVRVPERLMYTMGPHTVYLAGQPFAPPEALMFRDGPEY